jgi:hypothetical protein
LNWVAVPSPFTDPWPSFHRSVAIPAWKTSTDIVALARRPSPAVNRRGTALETPAGVCAVVLIERGIDSTR